MSFFSTTTLINVYGAIGKRIADDKNIDLGFIYLPKFDP